MGTFGHRMKDQWPLDPEILYLNHGTVGATPRRVLDAQQLLREEMERQPARFLLRELNGISGPSDRAANRIRPAAETVARFLGARGEDLVFVDNATTGVNAVLRSFPFVPGDEILIPNLAYGAIAYTADYVARRTGAKVVTVPLPFPVADYRDYIPAIEKAITPRTRIAIFDHITSETALIMPIAEMAACCKVHGVAVLVDAAHALGALDVRIESLDVDWYTGNMHKWALAPKGCGILWAAPHRQPDLHPTVISWGLDKGFAAEFDWCGTKDPTPYLSAPAAVQLMQEWGLSAMRQYNHDLAWSAGQWLMKHWGLSIATAESMIGTMITLPLPQSKGRTVEDAGKMQYDLLYKHKIEAPIKSREDRLWVRISAQIYNDLDDVMRFAATIDRM